MARGLPPAGDRRERTPIRYLGISTYRGGLLLRGAGERRVVVAGHAPELPGRLGRLGQLAAAPAPDQRRGADRLQESISGMSWGAADSSCLSWFPPVDLTTPTPNATLGAAPVSAFPDGDEPDHPRRRGRGSYISVAKRGGRGHQIRYRGFIRGGWTARSRSRRVHVGGQRRDQGAALPNAAEARCTCVSIQLARPTWCSSTRPRAAAQARRSRRWRSLARRAGYRLVIAGTRGGDVLPAYRANRSGRR